MAASEVISFEPYRLIPAERLLLKEEEVVNVGNRALYILVALAETRHPDDTRARPAGCPGLGPDRTWRRRCIALHWREHSIGGGHD